MSIPIDTNQIIKSLSSLTYGLSTKKLAHFYALESLNKQFYLTYADAFHSTREYGWRGWKELIGLLPKSQIKVLDIGCGGGRLADFLERVWVKEQQKNIAYYLGLERSPKLLAHARARQLNSNHAWHSFDWSASCDHRPEIKSLEIKSSLESISLSNGQQFDWVTLFGVMHHIYGFETRVRMIELCAQALAPNAVLSISLWNFGAQARYEKKKLDWSTHLEHHQGLKAELIENGDYLLGWAGDSHIPRYCHWMSPEEEGKFLDQIAQALPQLSPPIITTIEGDHNRYISWRVNSHE